MLDLTGYDAWALLEEQRFKSASTGRVFPYNPKTVGTYYRRGRDKLGIEDLKFHDFRHEATSRLFEAGLPIEKVALVTCLLYTSPSPRDRQKSRMPSSA